MPCCVVFRGELTNPYLALTFRYVSPGMEDAHATILNLDNPDESAAAQCGSGKKGKNSFFAVYDGHGGADGPRLRSGLVWSGLSWTKADRSGPLSAGSTVARYSGDTVHKRLRALDLYQEGKYSESMTRAFVKTDEDLRASACMSLNIGWISGSSVAQC